MLSTDIQTNNFFDFLKHYKIKKVDKSKNEYTHLSYGEPYGSYKIPNDMVDVFHELYDKELVNGTKLHIIERHNEYSCIVIDIDEKYCSSVTSRQHTEENIHNIIKIYNEQITNTFNIELDDPKMVSFIFEKDNVKTPKKGNEKYTKDGVHIMYPYIISNKYAQYHLRSNVIKKLKDNPEYLTNLPLKNELSDLIDKAVISSNGWFMYGSTKPDAETYDLKYILNGNMEKIEPSDYFENKYVSKEVSNKLDSISKFFSIRKFREENSIEIREDILGSIDNFKTSKIKRKKMKKVEEINNQELAYIVDSLSTERATNYTTWLEVGLALHNIEPDNIEYLSLWDNFSKKSDKYEEGYCEKVWKDLPTRNDGLNIGSLYYFSKHDNIDLYRSIVRIGLKNLIDISVDSGSDYDLAKVLHDMFKDQFVCGSGKKSGTWFQFENHRWNRMETNTELFKMISTQMCEEYVRRLSSCNIEASNQETSEEEREAAQKKSEKILKIIQKLKTNNSKKSIMDECKTLFYHKKFENELDVKPYLIGFNNGIYDLQNDEFREGRPDDYLSMNAEIDYVPFDIDDPNWDGLNNFLSTVFPDEDIKEYFFTFLSSCLQGVNNEEKFRIWVGSGSNGKSKIEELFNSSFGEYCMKFPITLLTGKRAASNACSPEIIRSKGKRFCYFEEPNENEKINTGRLKEYTGGDKIEGRGLYKDNIEFKPQFKLAVLTNYLPEVPPNDQGIWRRFEVIEFKSKFKDNPSETEKYEFPIDRHLSEKMENWKELFMGLLIDKYYKSYRKHGIIVPDEIIKHTKNYQKECDKYSLFVADVLVETKNHMDKIDITELHDEYKFWHEQNNNDNKFMSKTEFRKYLTKKFGRKNVKSSHLQGYTINKEHLNRIYKKTNEIPSIEDDF